MSAETKPSLHGAFAHALTVSLVWLALRLLLLAWTGAPNPAIHDEFSYLLEADLLAHGKFAMPTHPMAVFFESAQELVRPTYASKFPPGHALMMALGMRLVGHPIAGVVLESALLLFVFCLLLRIWTESTWAWATSLILGAALLPNMYWSNSYWGGSLAATGGALLLVAIGGARLVRHGAWGAVFAVGLAVLFLTRPVEGGVFALGTLIVFARIIRSEWQASYLAWGLPVLAAAVGFTFWMNQSVTGNPLLLPYLAHYRQYGTAPPLWILPVRPDPVYQHPRLAALHGSGGWEQRGPEAQRSLSRGLQVGFSDSLRSLLLPFRLAALPTWMGAIAVVLFAIFGMPDPRFRRFGTLVLISFLFLVFETWHSPHYMAPAWPAIWLCFCLGCERLWRWRVLGKNAGRILVIAFLVGFSALVLRGMFETSTLWADSRAAVLRHLEQRREPSLVFVHYPSPSWHIEQEWVFNGYDIDHQRVILAHDLGPEQNLRLIRYYPAREALMLTLEDGSALLTPYGQRAPSEQFPVASR